MLFNDVSYITHAVLSFPQQMAILFCSNQMKHHQIIWGTWGRSLQLACKDVSKNNLSRTAEHVEDIYT